MKNTIIRGGMVLLFLLILFNAQISIEGATKGLTLWYQVVVPTLLPCMILSNLIVQMDAARFTIGVLQPILGRFFHTSMEGTYTVLMGIICGYPMGAKTAADFIRKGKMTVTEGQYVLSFANLPSPMFLVGYVVTKSLGHKALLIPLLASVYIADILVGQLSYFTFRKKIKLGTGDTKIEKKAKELRPKFSFDMLDEAVIGSVEIIVKIGVYMMLFTLLSKLVGKSGLHATWIQWILMGAFEMTTGISQVAPLSTVSVPMKAAIIAAFASFGGLSTAMQTNSVMKGTPLNMGNYILWKVLHGILTGVLLYLYLTFLR
ncbi:MAG: hypothetical protein ACLRZ7_05715 [Lachnospiraceae bacterium]